MNYEGLSTALLKLTDAVKSLVPDERALINNMELICTAVAKINNSDLLPASAEKADELSELAKTLEKDANQFSNQIETHRISTNQSSMKNFVTKLILGVIEVVVKTVVDSLIGFWLETSFADNAVCSKDAVSSALVASQESINDLLNDIIKGIETVDNLIDTHSYSIVFETESNYHAEQNTDNSFEPFDPLLQTPEISDE